MKMVHISESLDPIISLGEASKDKLDIWSKKCCLHVVHTGVKKFVSNNYSLECFDSVIEAV